MTMLWKVYEENLRVQDIISKELGVTPLFAQILINRGIRTPAQAQDFLFGDTDSCHDPFLMKGMPEAVARIKRAVESGEKILIYGDYDVDGVTSTALLSETLNTMGANFDTFIPNRLEEGYGLNIGAVLAAKDKGVKLLITVDCGINSVDEIKCAADNGIDVIITDHHAIRSDAKPKAFAMIDPHQPDCPYPYKHLAGVGVAYKLAQALLSDDNDIERYLDLVALGSIADVAPLNGENRILAKKGLRKLCNSERPGLKALMDVAGVNPENVTCGHIGFALAPRINAMGRVGSAEVALKLLLSRDEAEARMIAKELDNENRNRQRIEKDILKEALDKARAVVNEDEDKIIVVSGDGWHPGVVGIVASRVSEEYNKPAILIAFDGDAGKGSGRGIDGFNLFGAVSEAGEYLEDFGGHRQACGIQIQRDNLENFIKGIKEVAPKYYDDATEDIPELKIDMQLPFSNITVKLINELKMLMPHGPENSEPVFATNSIRVKTKPRDIGRNGFKFLGTCGNMTCEAITFRKNIIKKPKIGEVVDLAYVPSINRWHGIESIQLNIRDLKVVG